MAIVRPGNSAKVDVPEGAVDLSGDQLPAYHIWRGFFRLIGRADRDRHGPSPFLDFVPVHDRERPLILATAIRVAADELACYGKVREALAAMETGTWRYATASKSEQEKAEAGFYDIDYQQRVRTLAERDALLRQLTPESRWELEAYVRQIAQGSRQVVYTKDFPAFYAPGAVTP